MTIYDRKRWFTNLYTEQSSGCWHWLGAVDKDGYGQTSIKRRPLKAHRVAYELFKGEIPRGMQVIHSCHNPTCVNPDHLSIGSGKDNMQSSKKVGRRLGRKIAVSEEVLEEIRILKASGYQHWEIANKTGVSERYVERVVSNQRKEKRQSTTQSH
jgi:hypothetical protein